MSPLEFVNYDGDSDPNTPVYQIAGAMREDLVIQSRDHNWEVLAYYYDRDQKRMMLEIGAIAAAEERQ